MAIEFSDDFELGDTTKWNATTQTSGVLTVESINPKFGLKHLRATTIAGAGQKRVYVQKMLSPTGTKNVRAYIYLAPTQLAPAERVSLIGIYGSASNYIATLSVLGGKLVAYYQDGTTVYKIADPNIQFPMGSYVCLELGVGNGEIHVWLDGTEVIAVANVNNSQVGNPIEARVGAAFTDAVLAQTVDADEVAIGDSYVGPYVPPPPPANGGGVPISTWIIGGVAAVAVVLVGVFLFRKRK